MRRIEERAAREGWDSPAERKAKILDTLYGLVVPRPGRPRKDAKPPDTETIVRVSRTLISASLMQQRLDLAKAKDGTFGPKIEGDIIAEAAQRALECRAERERARAAHESPS